jgi:hypothetical protein
MGNIGIKLIGQESMEREKVRVSASVKCCVVIFNVQARVLFPDPHDVLRQMDNKKRVQKDVENNRTFT